MRIALFIIILFLGVIVAKLEIMPARPISILGILAGIGWSGLLHDYFKSKKK